MTNRKEYSQQYFKEHKEQLYAYRQKWREEHREQLRAKGKAYYRRKCIEKLKLEFC